MTVKLPFWSATKYLTGGGKNVKMCLIICPSKIVAVS